VERSDTHQTDTVLRIVGGDRAARRWVSQVLYPSYGLLVAHTHTSAISPRDPREFCRSEAHLKFRGRRECRALDAPQPHVQK
jgi:hypothetical protein